MATLEEEVRALTEQIRALVGKGGPNIGQGANITAGLSSAIVGTTDTFAKLTFGTYTLANGLGDFNNVVSKLGGGLGTAFGNITEKLGKEAIYLNTALNEAGKSGVNFNNELGDYAAALGSARVSVPQFDQILKDSGQSIAGLAGNAQKGAERFLETGKAFQESRIVRQLEATGVGAEELNRVLVISSTMRRNLDFADEKVRARAAQSAADMAVEMDNVARLTGISRQEQERALQEQLKKKEVEIMIASMSEEEKASYTASMLQLKSLGPAFQDVLTIVTTGGVRNAEDNMKVAAMGPKMFGLVEQLDKIKGIGGEREADERRRIMAEINAEAARVAGNKAELEERARLTTSAGELGRNIGDVTVGIIRHGQIVAKQTAQLDAENAKRGKDDQLTMADFLKAEEAKIQKEREEAEKSLKPGALINRAEILIKDASAGVSSGFKDLVKITENMTKETFPGLNEALKPFKTEGAKEAFKHLVGKALPNQVNTSELTGAAAEDAKRKKEGKAEGGPMFGDKAYLVGEAGPEIGAFNSDSNLLSNKNLRSLFGESDTDLRNATSSLQSEMRNKIADLKSSSITAEQIEQAMTRVTAAMPKQLPQVPQDNTASNELIQHMERLNTNVRELITAVVDGSSANVKAVRSSGGNILA